MSYRPVTLFTGQWADMPLDRLAEHAADWGYDGPLSIEWEDSGMDRKHGAEEALGRVRTIDFPPAETGFEEAFAEE